MKTAITAIGIHAAKNRWILKLRMNNMPGIKIFFAGWLCLMIALLGGCYSMTQTTHAVSLGYLNKGMSLKSDMLLVESTHWNPTGNGGGRHWVFSFAHKRYFNNYVNLMIPTEEEYHENPVAWQKWHGGTLEGWAHLVGVLHRGTTFHITDITPRNFKNDYWVTIQVDSGAYKGTVALYVNAKTLIPDMYD